GRAFDPERPGRRPGVVQPERQWVWDRSELCGDESPGGSTGVHAVGRRHLLRVGAVVSRAHCADLVRAAAEGRRRRKLGGGGRSALVDRRKSPAALFAGCAAQWAYFVARKIRGGTNQFKTPPPARGGPLKHT